jgi:hypothetical protein
MGVDVRVTIEQNQKDYTSGLIFKKTHTYFHVVIHIEFNEAEKSILDKRKLWDSVLYEVRNDDYYNPFLRELEAVPAHPDSYEGRHPTPKMKPTVTKTIRDLCDPKKSTRSFDTPGEAKNWATELRGHIKKLKDIIEYNESTGKTETFDL